MEISGADYTYWTNVPGEKTAARFLEKMRSMWPAALVDDERSDGRMELFIAKDAAMEDFQNENGYALDEDGGGLLHVFRGLQPRFTERDTDKQHSATSEPRVFASSQLDNIHGKSDLLYIGVAHAAGGQ